MDQLQDLRFATSSSQLEAVGHRGRGAAPRGRHRGPGRDRHALRHAVRMADKLMMFKYIVKNVRNEHGNTVTFMPKPMFGDNGSGMHVHQSLWKGGEPLFFAKGLRRALRHGALVHRRADQARARPARRSRPDDELVQAAGARVRGAGQPRVLPAQPFGRCAAFRCTRRARRRSGSSSAAPTRPATRTSRSRRC